MRRQPGCFEQAHGGTLFLDEVADLASGVRATLLRVLQERQVVRLGGTAPIAVDVHLVAATHRDLRALVAAGGLRAAPSYRLHVVAVTAPPLRARRTDIVPLAAFFLRREVGRPEGFGPATLAALEAHPWPSNVRELEHPVERAALLARGPLIALEYVGREPGARPGPAPHVPSGTTAHPAACPRGPLADPAAERLVAALAACGGTRTAVARLLGVHRSTLWRRLHTPPAPSEDPPCC